MRRNRVPRSGARLDRTDESRHRVQTTSVLPTAPVDLDEAPLRNMYRQQFCSSMPNYAARPTLLVCKCLGSHCGANNPRVVAETSHLDRCIHIEGVAELVKVFADSAADDEVRGSKDT